MKIKRPTTIKEKQKELNQILAYLDNIQNQLKILADMIKRIMKWSGRMGDTKVSVLSRLSPASLTDKYN